MQKAPVHSIVENDQKLLKELLKQVNDRIKQLPESRLTAVKIKIFLLPALYLALYAIAFIWSAHPAVFYSMYILMGILLVIIFLNVIHEAAHGSIFKNQKYNSAVYGIFDFLGANSFMWKKRHILFHHRYPDVNGWDTDIEQSDLVTVFPNEPVKRHQRFQHIYVFLLYPFYMINWLLFRDFRDFFSKERVVHKLVDIPKIEYVKLFLFKSFYLFMMIIAPWWLGNASFRQALAGFIILSVVGSLMAMFVLLTPHANTEVDFPETDENGNLQMSWLRHQMSTTNDIESCNWVIRNVLANFTFHLSHHLFPGISSVYAPEVTEVIRKFSEEHHLPYRSLPLKVSFKKHYELLRSNALSYEDLEM